MGRTRRSSPIGAPRPVWHGLPSGGSDAPQRPSALVAMMSGTSSSGQPRDDTTDVGKPTPTEGPGSRRLLRYTHATVPIAVLTFQFDPFAHLFGDLTVRWGSIALVVVIVAALILAGVLARAGGLRPDDVAFVAVGIVPGAVIGGRIGYFLAPRRLLRRLRPAGSSIRRSAGWSSVWPWSAGS